MNLLTCMSLSGSIGTIFYLICKKGCEDTWTARMRYCFLKVIMLLYLLPLPLLKQQFLNWIREIPGLENFMTMKFNQEWTKGYLISKDVGGVLIRRPISLIVAFLAIVLVIIILVACRGIQYSMFWKELNQQLVQDDTVYIERLRIPKKSTFMKKQEIKVGYCKMVRSPITIGIFHPKIVLTKKISEQDKELIVKHELIHIRKYDVGMKVISLMVIVLNWYNPLAYYLYRELQKTCELACDEQVVENMSQEERRRYGHVLINMAEQGTVTRHVLSVGISNGYKNMLERINLIMETRECTKGKKVLAGILVGASFLISSMSAFAYEPLQTLELDTVNPMVVGDVEQRCINEQEVMKIQEPPHIDYQNFIDADMVLVDENGNIYPVYEDSIMPAATCNHSYGDGYLEIHQKESTGTQCHVITYKVKLCSKCKAYKDPVYYSTTTYAICPH